MLRKRRKYYQDHLTSQSYLSGLLTGLFAGLAAGLLFAPRSGKDLRRQIAGAVTDQTREFQYQWDKTKAQAKETLDTIKTNVGFVTNRAQDEFNIYADKAENKAGQLANDTKSRIDKLKASAKVS